MKETESPVEPIAEAVRGLARDRTYLIEVREAYIQEVDKDLARNGLDDVNMSRHYADSDSNYQKHIDK